MLYASSSFVDHSFPDFAERMIFAIAEPPDESAEARDVIKLPLRASPSQHCNIVL
jgi:hypothetical protein